MTDRRTGSVGLSVDVVPVPPPRRVGSVGLTVDLIPAIEVGLATAQAQALSLAVEVTPGGVQLTVATTQAQAVALRWTPNLTVGLTQTTQASLSSQFVRSVVVAATQAQAVSSAFVRGYQRIVTATQATAVTRRLVIVLMRKLAGQGVRTRVERKPELGIQPTVATTARTQVRLIREIRLARALQQPQATSTAVVHIDVLQTVTATVAHSLALVREVTLQRSLEQAQAVMLPRGLELLHTFVQPTTLLLGRAIDLVRTITIGSSATVASEDVTVRYELVVSVTQPQAVGLTMSSTGAPAKHFVIRGRHVEFVTAGRSSQFVARNRRVRFTAEER